LEDCQMWLLMLLVSVCDVPGAEYARSMAKLAKTLQQTMNEDVRLAVSIAVDYHYMLLWNAYSVKKYGNCIDMLSFVVCPCEVVCLLVRYQYRIFAE